MYRYCIGVYAECFLLVFAEILFQNSVLERLIKCMLPTFSIF